MTEPSRITGAEFEALVRREMFESETFAFSVVSLGAGEATIRLAYHRAQLRAGGTLSGPTMFTLADTALYAAVLSKIGMQPLAVTSELSIRYLRKPEPRALIAHARLVRIGRRSAVGTIELASEGDVEGVLVEPLVAHAVGTYALP